MRSELDHEKYLTFSPGLILGGTMMNYDHNHAQGNAAGKSNVISKTALARGDLRYITIAQKEKAEQKIIKMIDQHLPGTTGSVSFQDGIPSMPPTQANLALLKTYSSVSERLGYGTVKPLDPGLKGAGDISYAAPYVSSALAGLGPSGSGAHSVKETLDISSLPVQTDRAALLIYELTR
jgi:glutamate carboxypeptidase